MHIILLLHLRICVGFLAIKLLRAVKNRLLQQHLFM